MKLRVSGFGLLAGIALITGAIGGWKLFIAETARAEATVLDAQRAELQEEAVRLVARQDAARKRAVAVEADIAWLRANMAKPPAGSAPRALSPQDALKRIEAAVARENDEDAEETLRELLWSFDEGVLLLDATQKRRQRMLLIARLGQLSRSYPPAKAAIVERQERLRMKYLEVGGLDDALSTFSALSRAVGDHKATLALFDALPAEDPRRRAASIYAYEELVAARRYQEALQGRSLGGGDIRLELAAGKRAEVVASTMRLVMRDVEALAGVGRIEEAQKLIDKVRATDDSAPTRELMRYHLERAGRLDLMP